NGNVQLCDFGLSRIFEDKSDLIEVTDVVGSIYSLAPEQLRPSTDEEESESQSKSPTMRCVKGRKVDLWMCGCVLYALLMKKRPFQHDTTEEVFDHILKGDYDPLPDSFSREVRDLLGLLLQTDPSFRPYTHSLLSHPWFTRYKHSKPSIARGRIELEVSEMHYHLSLKEIWQDVLALCKSMNIDTQQHTKKFSVLCIMGEMKFKVLFQRRKRDIYGVKKRIQLANQIEDSRGSDMSPCDSKGSNDKEYSAFTSHSSAQSGTESPRKGVLTLEFYLKCGFQWEFQRIFRMFKFRFMKKLKKSGLRKKERALKTKRLAIEMSTASPVVDKVVSHGKKTTKTIQQSIIPAIPSHLRVAEGAISTTTSPQPSLSEYSGASSIIPTISDYSVKVEIPAMQEEEEEEEEKSGAVASPSLIRKDEMPISKSHKVFTPGMSAVSIPHKRHIIKPSALDKSYIETSEDPPV
ncbi:hypothetical protein ADUPG1_009541, partial [Aduncisulcus paluster]